MTATNGRRKAVVCTTSRLARRVATSHWRLGLAICVSTWSLLWAAPALASGPPALEEEGSVLSVTSTSAKLQAQINPEESNMTYRFEYLTEAEYQANLVGGHEPFAGALLVPSPYGSLGAGSTGVTVRVEPEGLLPGTTYHYRVVATGSGTVDGMDRTFTTRELGGEFSLLDARQWELVSSPNKHGATIYPLTESGVLEAAADGSAITYMTNAPTELEPKGSSHTQLQVLSRRGGSGWSTEDIATPNNDATGQTVGIGFEYRFFSSDLSLALVEPQQVTFTPLSPQATERTPYIRSDSSCEVAPATCYEPLVTSADVAAGVKFGGSTEGGLGEVSFEGATPDLSHVLLNDERSGLTSTPGDEGGLYEWSPSGGGQLQLVSILPESEGGRPARKPEEIVPGGRPSGRNEISADGSRIFWTAIPSRGENLYLRDMVKGETGETLRIGDAHETEFQIANSEGSRVFFISKIERPGLATEETLEACDVVEVIGKLACEPTALAPDVQGGVIGASEDGSYVYFVSKAALAANAKAGEDNLYVDHNNGTTWEAPTTIAILPEEDKNDWSSALSDLTARVSPNGEWLAFMSRKSLTGYDNRDAVSGVPDEEVYLYDARDKRLACASCNPTGARPVGSEYGMGGDYGENGLLGGGNEVWRPNTWLAANISGWTDYAGGASVNGAEELYQTRYLSDSGRLFFNAGDALVPQDVNGTWDVYEYEPEGVGSCGPASTSGSVVYRPERQTASGAVEPAGCVGLISSGESTEQSAFLDASENGDDVFFLTTSQLSPQDVDTFFDVYDARVCSASAPCVPSPVSSPPCDTAEACRASVTPQPEVFGAPDTATFSGAGNVTPQTGPPAKPSVKKKTVKCKRGFVKRKVNKQERCVKLKDKKQAKRASRNRGTRS
jgi:hypothetical protein